MPATAGNSVASLTGELGARLQQLQGLGVQVPGLTGGGGAAAGQPQTAAAGQPGATGQPAAGAANGIANPTKIPATGKPEIRQGADVKTRYYDSGIDPATGQRRADGMALEITAFQYTESHQFKINLDYREGIATGLANLSRIFGARQERVRLLSNALANDANNTGSFNPVDLQKMSLETTTTQQLSEMQKKIFDSMRDSIQAWLR